MGYTYITFHQGEIRTVFITFHMILLEFDIRINIIKLFSLNNSSLLEI